uniref:Ycf1 protein n=1 Tax=Parietaria mauritanica TaxID=2590075 RepID=UPI0021820C43|nr:Ycf1 protein [Parietaria mauritanica]UVF31677.1 Ycf1 protein [Parietaria mauritanica]
MIFQSFILSNLVSLCIKIINSVVVVGLYYGFLTTFSIGPSYLFLLRARLMEEGEEGTEKKVSATTGFITGQLMMFVSIYYVPLHLALGRPHTITVLALPYLLFHFFWNNHKHFFDYGSTNRNSMRNLSIQCVFLNNLIFQLFNHFILPSSMLVRLVNIYMFRCNNKMLFVTSSFVGWLIGHIFLMKWVGLVLVWIQQNNSIRSNKYLVSELRNFMARIFSILLFITCVYYLGRIPSPILTNKLKETSERGESEEETDVETTSETKGTKQEQEGSTGEDPSPSLFSEEKEDPDKIDETEEIRVNGKEKTKEEFLFKETQYKNRPVYETYYLDVDRNKENSKLEIFKEKKDLLQPPLTILFEYKGWNRTFWYIKNNQLENVINFKNEMSQYFFHTCKSDGKEKISLTYPPSLSIFFEMIYRKIALFTLKKPSPNELYTNWSYNNKEKRKYLNTKFLNRIKTLDKTVNLKRNYLILDILEKKKRLCKLYKLYNNNTKKEYLPKVYDPFLNSASRGQIKKKFSPSIEEKIYIQNYKERDCKNKIRDLFLIFNNLEFEDKKTAVDKIDKKSLKKKIINPECRKRKIQFILKRLQADPTNKDIIKPVIGLKEIKKKIPQWSYQLIDDFDFEQEEAIKTEDLLEMTCSVDSRERKIVVVFNDGLEDTNTSSTPQDPNNNDDETDGIYLIHYSQESDFDRDIIADSIQAQRRKTVIWKAFEANVYSPTFLNRIDKDLSFYFDISSETIKNYFQNYIWKNPEFKIIDYTETRAEESTKKNEEKKRKEEARIEIGEIWDRLVVAQVIRGLLLVSHSILRKYIILPSLIILKNIGRIIFFQFPEWSEDLKDWKREMHVKCTYNGVQLSETEFPKNWLSDGIQIKILFPFHLKPWHKSKFNRRETYNYPMKNKEQNHDFFFLTVFGMETELPFGSPRKKLSFFEPILKELKKKLIKLKKKCFRVIIILKERINLFLNISKETIKWFSKKIHFRKNKINELSKINQIILFLFGWRQIEIDELNESKKEKTFKRNNEIIHESSINIDSRNFTTFSLIKKKIHDLTDRRKTIINQIETISKDNKKKLISLPTNISFNKMSYDDKRLAFSKNIRQTLKIRNIQQIRKENYFLNFLIQRIYIKIFLYISNIPRISVQFFFSFFFESTKKILNKYSSYNNYFYNNETNEEKIDKTNQNKTQLFYTIKESIFNISNKNPHPFCNLSYLSQAYVFYKLSQNTVFNFFNLYKLKLRYVIQYNGTSFFLKNEIKNYFIRTHKILDSDLRHRKLRNSGIPHCKNLIKGYYQDDLSLSTLVPQKRKNIVNQHFIVQNKHLNKHNLYQKNQLLNFEKQKKNVKKQYRYNLLSYNFIKYKDKTDYYSFGLPLQVNHNHYIFYNYNKHKRKVFNRPVDIPINNYLVEKNILDIKKNSDRKYFDWLFLSFRFRKNTYIRAWNNMDTDNDNTKYTKIRPNNYKIINKIDKKNLFSLTVDQNQEINQSNKIKLFDWMRMNEEILSCPISNLELWFFPEFLILYNSYKIKSWGIPIKFLLNVKETPIENKNNTVKKKRNIFLSIFSNHIKFLELEKKNQRQKNGAIQTDFESILLTQEKDSQENYAAPKKKKNKKQYTKNINLDAEFDFLLKTYLLFQLKWNDFLNQKTMNNIKVYCLLLRLINPKEVTIASIERRELNLDILMIDKNLSLTELLKQGILLIEPIRLSIKKQAKFIMSQTIGISLVHKSKYTINQKYIEKSHVDKTNSGELISKYQPRAENRYKNHYNLFVPESILSPRRRRELRILICFYFINRNDILLNANRTFCNENKEKRPVLNKRKRYKNTLIKLKFFLWPNYRLEDFACINRYWFDTNNGSRFSMIRTHIYPQFKNERTVY